MGFKVGLIDADIYGPSIPLMFDVQHAKPMTVHVDGKNKMGPVDGYGVKVMSIGFFANMDQAVVSRRRNGNQGINPNDTRHPLG